MENQNDIYNRWQIYMATTDNRICTMWNFILYNQFNDNEYKRLNNQINSLNKIIDTFVQQKKDLECCDEPIKKKKKIIENIQVNQLKIDYGTLKTKYNFMKKNDKDKTAQTLYSKLDTIQDIIKLQDCPYKFDFINDEKFTKLYNIIPALEELNKIIGMQNVKTKLFNSICYFLHSMNNKEEMNHVMLMGPPGVGKTTIAKIIGDLYLKLGFLKNNNFIVAKRSDLIAKYLGQTAIKTQEVIDSALGGVLFIDEVYSLGSADKKDSFAKECIDTINLNMSLDKPWLLIVGGYKEEIETEFLAYNRGLERRFTVKLEINEYSALELFNILMKFINEEHIILTPGAITIDDITKNYKDFKYFGGDMRKLLQLAKEYSCVRNMKETLVFDMAKTVTRDDFIKSLKHFNKKVEEVPYQTMYI